MNVTRYRALLFDKASAGLHTVEWTSPNSSFFFGSEKFGLPFDVEFSKEQTSRADMKRSFRTYRVAAMIFYFIRSVRSADACLKD